MNFLALANRVLRFKVDADSWAKRGVAEQSALAGLRSHPGFPALQDAFEAEVAMTFFKFLGTAPEERDVLRDLHAQGRAMIRMVRILDDTTLARDRAQQMEQQIEEAQRIMEAHRAHSGRRRAAVAAAGATAPHV